MLFYRCLVITCLALGLGACGSVPPPPAKLTLEERAKLDDSVGASIQQTLGKNLKRIKAPEVESYLKDMAQRIASAEPELKGAQFQVTLFHPTPSNDPEGYAIPRARLFLPVPLLKNARYENELAALIAFHIGHLARRHLVQRPEGTPVEKLFAYTDEEQAEAVERGVLLLYGAGYDVRGMNQWLSGINEPEDRKSLLIARARQTQTQLSPLRNPLVRTEAFLNAKRRIQNL